MTLDEQKQSQTMVGELDWTYRHQINGTLCILTWHYGDVEKATGIRCKPEVAILERNPDTLFGGNDRRMSLAMFRRFYRRIDGGDYWGTF
jgi:hypothetical protein